LRKYFTIQGFFSKSLKSDTLKKKKKQ
jgi:hypothetical protein